MYRIMFIHLLLILKTLSKVKMDALLLQEKLKNDFTLNIIFHISNKNVPFTYTCIDLYFIYIFNVISQFQDFYLCIFIYTQLHVHVSANMNLLNISSYMHILKHWLLQIIKVLCISGYFLLYVMHYSCIYQNVYLHDLH